MSRRRISASRRAVSSMNSNGLVAAGAQAAHALVDSRKGAQDQHGRDDAGTAQRSQHAEAFEAACQHPVEHDRIVLGGDGQHQAIAAGLGRVDAATVIGECVDNLFTCLAVVLDDQNVRHTGFRSRGALSRQGAARTDGFALRYAFAVCLDAENTHFAPTLKKVNPVQMTAYGWPACES
jgi:hypothetical protein